jgi:hypothetical protein
VWFAVGLRIIVRLRVWVQNEILENHRRQTQRVRLEFGLGLSLGRDGRTIWIVDAHRDDGKRFVVRADEMLTAFLELESAIRRRNGIKGMHEQEAV